MKNLISLDPQDVEGARNCIQWAGDNQRAAQAWRDAEIARHNLVMKASQEQLDYWADVIEAAQIRYQDALKREAGVI
jgi:hypothetical protein